MCILDEGTGSITRRLTDRQIITFLNVFFFSFFIHICAWVCFVCNRKYLERITSVGPRPAGSAENEIMTVSFLLEQVERVRRESADGPNTITVETHKHSGSFSIDFLGGFTSCYDQIVNIVVRLEPKGGAQHFVLANCHFDSVLSSPGEHCGANDTAFHSYVGGVSSLNVLLGHAQLY